MSAPRSGDWTALKRVARYLLGRPRLVWKFIWQDSPKFISTFSDSNWACFHDTRKSTSGACIMNGSHLIKAYRRSQSNIALSSGEAEFYALVAAASEALGIVAMTDDFGTKPMRTCTLMPVQLSVGRTERGWGGSGTSTPSHYSCSRH